MEAFAFGQVGLSPEAFYDLTPRQWANKVSGWEAQINLIQQQEWERIRWQTTWLVNPHTKKKLSPKDLMVFPWEEKKKKAHRVWSRGEVLNAINERKLNNGKSLKS